MEATELRIGNLVYRADYLDRKEIDKVTGYDLWHSEQLQDVRHKVEWKSLSPIPLTEEWLVKLGFSVNERFPRQRQINDFSLISRDGRFIYLLLGYAKSVEVKYVHQLQNLYYAITGEELKHGER